MALHYIIHPKIVYVERTLVSELPWYTRAWSWLRSLLSNG